MAGNVLAAGHARVNKRDGHLCSQGRGEEVAISVLQMMGSYPKQAARGHRAGQGTDMAEIVREGFLEEVVFKLRSKE